MIETALIFIIFASLLLGIMDFGQFLFIHQALVERARYAARWGAVTNPSDSAAITNMVLYNQPSSPPPAHVPISICPRRMWRLQLRIPEPTTIVSISASQDTRTRFCRFS